MNSNARLLACCASVLMLSGCGLKGPLYPPPPEVEESELPASSTSTQPKTATLKKSQQAKNPSGSTTAPVDSSTPAVSQPK